MTRPLARPEKIAWAQLARTPRIGPLTFHRLIARFGSAAAALEALPRIGHGVTPPSSDQIAQELDNLERMGACLIAACEPDYPALLAALDAPPAIISARGDVTLLKRPAIAIVGAREASAAGLLLAERFAADLSAAGFVIVSGLARGVDASAHRAALARGTIAVLAGGLDKPYPPQNLKLHDDIAERGLVISEAPLGVTARARDFPRRNHIVSGLSRGVVVIEAALRSGSLITARAAGEQGRDVMAAPGSPLDPRASGGNALIKQGAALVENAEDVIAVLGAAPTSSKPRALPLFDANIESPPAGLAMKIGRLLSPTPVHMNDLIRLANASASAIAVAITELELEGRAASLPGGYVASPRAAFRASD
ncbi:MAG: DNA-processing protein DprA [Caulobacterales bacterium]